MWPFCVMIQAERIDKVSYNLVPRAFWPSHIGRDTNVTGGPEGEV